MLIWVFRYLALLANVRKGPLRLDRGCLSSWFYNLMQFSKDDESTKVDIYKSLLHPEFPSKLDLTTTSPPNKNLLRAVYE